MKLLLLSICKNCYISGNVIAMAVLLSSKELRSKPVNLFMIHQSFIDFWACMIMILTRMYASYTYDSHNTITDILMCRFWQTRNILWGVVHSSGYNLMFLTLERYWAITKPLKYDPNRVLGRLPFIFVSTWIIGIVTMLPKITTSRVHNSNCIPYLDIRSAVLMKLLTPYFACVSSVIPASVMIYSYAVMWAALQKSQGITSTVQQQNKSTAKRAQTNLLQTCTILMVFFVLSWVQQFVIFLLYTIGYYDNLNFTYYHVSMLCIISNLCLNPYIYSVRYNDFQTRLMNIFGIRVD